MIEGNLYRPPSEGNSYILQATVGCSWNKCTYCAMYRDKTYRVREIAECIATLEKAGTLYGHRIQKLFVADGDALAMPTENWVAILETAQRCFPALQQVSCYALASNVLEKSPTQLRQLRELGLRLLYIGPESGDDITLKRVAKGLTAVDHVQAAERVHEAGMTLSTIFLLGIAGIDRSQIHAEASADLLTAMDPEFVATLTTILIPDTPLYRKQEKGLFQLPSVESMLKEVRTIVDRSRPSHALFRTNHASNYLPLEGYLPRDRTHIIATIDQALSGKSPLRAEFSRGL